MPKQISSLSIGLFGDVSHFAKSFGSTAVSSVKNFAGSIAGAGSTLLAFSGIGAAVAAGFEAIKHIGDGFKLAADLEKTQIQFTALIGDSEKAKTAIEDLTQFAKSTPFELPALIDTSRQLLAFGVSNEKLLPSLKAIGDVAAGVGQPLEEVTAIFGRVAEEGTLSERSLRQFAKAGIPVVEELAKQMGVTKEQIKDLATNGQIGFGQLQNAFAGMTGPSGKFAGQMEKQAGSLGGLWTRLSGTVEESLGGIAQQLIVSFNLKAGISALNNGLSLAGTTIKSFISAIAPTVIRIGSGFVAAYHVIEPIVEQIYQVVIRTFGMIVGAVTPILTGLWGTIQSVWTSIYGFIAPIVTSIYQSIAANWQAILTTIYGVGIATISVLSSAWGIVADIASAVWSAVVAVWQWGSELITGHSVSAGDAIVGAWSGIGAAAHWLADTVSLAFNVAAFAVTHWKDGIEIAVTQAAASLMEMRDRTLYVLTDAIPYALEFFGRNWKEIFIDVFNYTKTVLTNLTTNIVSIFSNLPGLIAGTTNWGDVWKPMTEGFKSQIKETFQLPTYASSELTKSLTAEADKLEAAYGKGLGTFINSKEAQAAGAAKSTGDWIKKALGFGEAPIIPKVSPPEPVKTKVIPSLTADNLTVAIKPEIKHGDIVRFNSAESQLLRFEFAHNIAAKEKGKKDKAAGAAAPEAPPVAPQPPPVAAPRPPAPISPPAPPPAAPPYQSPTSVSGSIEGWRKEAHNDWLKPTDYLFKIWQNSEPGNQVLQTATF